MMNLHRTREGWEDEDSVLAQAMNSLREASFDGATSHRFDRDLIRRVKANQIRDGIKYWMPGLLGATLAAGILFLAISQVDLSMAKPKANTNPDAQVRHIQVPPLTAD